MRLGDKQRLHARNMTKLRAYLHAQGWEMTEGEAAVISPRKVYGVASADGPAIKMRPLVDAEHRRGSLHYKKLADDLNLFVKGKYIRSSTHPAYLKLGRYWERLHPLCAWGGRFSDGNHFSTMHGGKK